ncbi:MAG: hypothetical protein E7653_03680 [Ruminococcaceae bacterium]|nr:hypothetical protein [Oscillospiraceae bacterium]
MLKYKNIIEQLSDMDKVRILSDVDELGNAKYRTLGIPALKFASFEDYCHGTYPSTVALMNTWDTSLIGDIAADVAGRMRADGVSVAEVKGPKPKIDPCRVALSEDPWLASVACSQIVREVYNGGVNVSLSDYGIRTTDTKWLDAEVNDRFVNEYIINPFSVCADSAKICALETRGDILVEGYQKINSALEKKAEIVCDGARAICREMPTEKTVKYLQNGGMFYKGSAVALEAALHRYNNLCKAIKHNTSSEEELEAEIQNGRAISPETLDEAVDKLLDFAFSLKRDCEQAMPDADASISLRAARESIVLLKNEKNMLPLKKKGYKVALIGDLVMGEDNLWENYAEAIMDTDMTFAGARRGYDIDKERSEELTDAALELCKDADIAIVFLGLGKKREAFATRSKKISIPANQQHLLRKLEKYASKVIVVISGDIAPDIVYYNSCSALLYAPIDTSLSARALMDVLKGSFNPTGRLANTVYFDSDELYENRRKLVLKDKIKTGPFFGYRHYDAYEIQAGYVFGYGLSFTEFSYSELTVDGMVAKLKVKNTGNVAGVETVQIYVGVNDSAIVRPRKELMGYARVRLEAGEEIDVSIPFDIPYLYDGKDGGIYVEKGVYTVYAGASVLDIRAAAKVSIGGAEIEHSGEVLSEYVQIESNILSDKYKLEEDFTVMRRKSVFNFIAGGVSLALALALKMYCLFANVEAIFFDLFAIALGIVGITFLVLEAVYRNREYKEDKAKLDEVNAEMFKDAEEIPVYVADRMFIKEFDVAAEEKVVEVADAGLEGVDAQYHLYIDSEQSFENAVREFELLATEKGFKFNTETVRELFASIASSRLVFVKGLDEEHFKNLLILLGGFFETTSHFDVADDSYATYDNVLFKKNDQGARIKTDICLSFDAARNTPQNIHFAGLYGAALENFNTYFEPFVNFAKNPLGACRVTALNESYTETTYYIPQNLWFIVNIGEDERIDALSQNVLDVATVTNVRFVECESTPHHDGIKKFSYYQLDYLTEKLGVSADVDEDDWKKLDRLEEYVAAHTQYNMGNKMWLCLEKYVAVYLACAGDRAEVLETAVCSKILPSVVSALSGNMDKEEKSFCVVLEDILGEDSVDKCKEFVKTSRADIV